MLKNPKMTEEQSNLELVAEQHADTLKHEEICYTQGDEEYFRQEIARKVHEDDDANSRFTPGHSEYVTQDFRGIIEKNRPNYWLHTIPLGAGTEDAHETGTVPREQELTYHEDVIGGFHKQGFFPGFVIDKVHEGFAKNLIYAPRTTLKKLTEANPQIYLSKKLMHGVLARHFNHEENAQALFEDTPTYKGQWRKQIRDLTGDHESDLAEIVLSGALADSLGIQDEETDYMHFDKKSSMIVTPVDKKPRLTIHDYGMYENHTIYSVNRSDC